MQSFPCARLAFSVSNNWKTPKQSIKALPEAISSPEQLKDKKLRKIFPITKLFVARAKEVMKLADS
jgi:hypothetical protein